MLLLLLLLLISTTALYYFGLRRDTAFNIAMDVTLYPFPASTFKELPRRICLKLKFPFKTAPSFLVRAPTHSVSPQGQLACANIAIPVEC